MEEQMRRIKVLYQYRDASNSKKNESVVVEGESPEQVKTQIEKAFVDCQGWPDITVFQPERWGWPTAYFDSYNLFENDVAFHELCEVTLTNEAVTHEFTHSR